MRESLLTVDNEHGAIETVRGTVSLCHDEIEVPRRGALAREAVEHEIVHRRDRHGA